MAEFDHAPLRIDGVALTVHDLDRVSGFYREVLGLVELDRKGECVSLGAGETVLLELRRDRQARIRSPREAGLFHTAFLLPSRADLGRWLGHARAAGLPIQGASDHVVSEAIYLADPEGNGIEIYADRPARLWAFENGALAMRTDPLDIADLLANAGSQPWTEAPDETVVGHVHLQVGSIEPADAFFGTVLGLDLTARYPGASFFSSGGYHHHLAANIWNSRNAPPRSEPSTGLAEVLIRANQPETLAAIGARAEAAGIAASKEAGRLTLRDPWNTAITLATGAT